jgi:predicted aldo/keto reductase-like oxidoreductase
MYIHAINELPLSLILIWSNYLEDMYLPEISAEIMPHAKKNGVGITAMKPLADGFLYQNPVDAIRYSLGSGAEVLVCGMNTVDHVRTVSEAIRAGAADDEERKRILKDAPELGTYVCRQCGECSEDLMELFRLEGYADRQMTDYLEHDPANYALRLRLRHWFSLGDTARQRYREKGWSEESLIAAARAVSCPYGIDVPRKTTLAITKLEEGDTNLV